MLDEIGDMPAELQTRLLRVLADGEFYPVGAHTPKQVDVRIIAATHQDLEQRVKDGLFREDLFHRLNVIRINIPPLRERRQDIPLLMDYFLARAAQELEVEPKTLNAEVETSLMRLDWPGNVRQLENLCRWLTVMAPGQEIRNEDLPVELLASAGDVVTGTRDWQPLLRQWVRQQLADGREQLLEEAMPAFERIMIETALQHTGGRRQEAARLLGWGRNTLTRKLKEFSLQDSA
jgi:two-component system nitrogen regulation response regulator GlnG